MAGKEEQEKSRATAGSNVGQREMGRWAMSGDSDDFGQRW